MYTHTDEAPMLATYSLLPVLRAYCRFAGVKIMKKVSGRNNLMVDHGVCGSIFLDRIIEGLPPMPPTPDSNGI